MKSKRFLLSVAGIGICVMLLQNCSKEDPKELAPAVAAVAQDGESQDAVSENITQSLDNILDAVEANNFSGLKAGTPPSGITVTIDKTGVLDLNAFPKKITITYNIDTVINGEHAVQTGQIKVDVSLTQQAQPWTNYIKRVITIDQANPFTVTTDSFSVSLYGSRTMMRKSVKLTAESNTKLRMAVLDTIYSDLNFKVTCGDFTGNFTQQANKSRQAIAYYEKPGNFFRQNHSKDSLVYKGKVQGTNLKGEAYSRTIVKPVVFTVCPSAPFNPVVSQGEIELVNGGQTAKLSYSADACKTKAVVTMDGASKEISRKLNHRFYKWW